MRVLQHWRHRAALFWYRADTDAWIFASIVGTILAAFGVALAFLVAEREARRERLVAAHQENLQCLARNIYFEARGEPLAGQYAVAEVTMNRKAAALYPRTVCEVVYEKAAFSWTLLGRLPEPMGKEWQLAQQVAESVYYGRNAPVAKGALFYHATYVRPAWAASRERIGRIGRHVFYR